MALLRRTAILLLGLTLAACTGVPDRSAEARQLETNLYNLPGVGATNVDYTNDFTHGTHIEISIGVDQASEQQITDVATKLNELRGNDFDEFEQSVKFSVARTATVATGSEVDPAVIARGAGEARRIVARLGTPADFVELRPGSTGSSVQMRSATDPNQAVAVVVEEIGPHAGSIEIRRDADGSQPSMSWDITGPITVERLSTLRQQLGALPGTATFMLIKDGYFQQVNLTLPNAETAYQDVASAVRILGGSPEHPLRLAWGIPTKFGEPRWAGSVDIGRCVNNIDITGSDQITADARAVQERIRGEFSGCPR